MATYCELHSRSAFSFLRGASTPEALVAEAARRGLPALAVCCGFSAEGLPLSFQLVGKAFDEPTVFGLGDALERHA